MTLKSAVKSCRIFSDKPCYFWCGSDNDPVQKMNRVTASPRHRVTASPRHRVTA